MSQSGSYNAGGGGGGTVTTLTGNSGGAVGPTLGNINVVGSGTISVAGNPGTSTLTISTSGAVASSFPTDAGTATPIAGALQVLGGSNIGTTGATNVVTVNLDDTVSISGSMTAATGLTVSAFGRGMVRSSVAGVFSSINGTDGQVIIAATGADPIWASLTAGSGISITPGANSISIAATGGSGIATLNGDSGSATGATVTIAGGSNITTSAAGSTLTVDLDSTVSISGSMTAGSGFVATTNGLNIIGGRIQMPATSAGLADGSIFIGGNQFLHSFGTQNTFTGEFAGNGSLTAADTTGIGFAALLTLSSGNRNTAIGSGSQQNNNTGDNNTSVGYNSLTALNGAGSHNTAIGSQAGTSITTGTDNTALGYFALRIVDTGSYNTALGQNAGTGLSGSDSSNISISNLGTAGDNNIIRIGTQGTGNGQQDSCFIAGIVGVTPALSPEMVVIGTDGELGSQPIASGGISTLNGDSGSATGATVTIAGGSNITTSAAASTVTVDLDNTVSISGSMTAGTGFTATTGDVTISAGNLAIPATTSSTAGRITQGGGTLISSFGATNTFVGLNSGNLTLSGAANNTGIGQSSLSGLTNGDRNTALGNGAGLGITSGLDNTLVGHLVGQSITTGQMNTILGSNAGGSYTSSESNNIVINNAGVVGESAKIRIGVAATHTGCFIAGIYGVTPASSPQMATIGSNGELGSQALPSAGMTWSEQTGTTQAMAVNNGYILNNAGLVTATLPATAAVGQLMEIVGKGAGGWLLAQNSGQTVHFGNQNTTTGAGGSLASTNRYDCISIICTTANTDFVIKSSIGNITVV